MLNRNSFAGLETIFAFDNWPMLLLGRLLDRKTGFVAYRKQGFDILVDHRGGDQCGTRMCIATDTYRRYLPLMRLPQTVRVLDLGANGGGFPLMLSLEGIKLSQAICVEMNPMTFRRLQLNLGTNLGSSSVAINAAVCAMPLNSEILMKPSRGGTGDSMYNNRADAWTSNVAVKTTTLEALYEGYFDHELIDICKIDIEGAEFELVASASDDLLRKIRYLIMEIHYFDEASLVKAQALIAKLAMLGFVDITIADAHHTNLAAEVRAFAGPAAASGLGTGLDSGSGARLGSSLTSGLTPGADRSAA